MASDTKTNANANDINRATTGRDAKDTNPDLITGAPGSHPIGTGVGAAVGGTGAALAGAAIGAAMSGPAAPIGAVIGAVIGAFGGGLVGKSAGEAIDPTAEDAYWREKHKTRDYVQKVTEPGGPASGATYEKDLRPAYQYGWESTQAHQGKSFDEAEPTLKAGWEKAKGESKLGWDHAKHATRDAWEKLSGGSAAGAHDLKADAREVVPVIKEDLQVGKQQVETGGVRVTTHIEEKPVEAQVKLREEEVHVNRKAVDRPIAAGDATAFQEGVVELTERDEVAVVSKDARVVEEVVIGKTATERTETVADTVRQTKVDVQPAAATGTAATAAARTTATTYQPFGTYGSAFRTHYQQSAGSAGGQYEAYEPAYQYGYNLATDERYRDVNDWNKVEAGARTSWEQHNTGTWDKFKSSVLHAWDSVRGAK